MTKGPCASIYGEKVRRYPPDLVQRTQNKPKIVYAASRLEDLAVPPGNSFVWDGTRTLAIEVVDYH